jgi:hypothetical protein
MPELAYSATRHRQRLAEVSDGELLGALRGGDEAALDELIGRKSGPLVQLVFRILGDA